MMRCRSATPYFWMRTMYPCVVRPVLEEVVEPALKKSFVQLAEAGHSPQELIDQAWAEAQQDGRFGGCGLGGHAQTTDASFAAAVLSVYPSLCDTVALRGMPLSPVAGEVKRQCRCCSTLRSTTMTSATAWRCRAHLRGACTRQGVWPLPHVRAWPLLSVHAAVGAAHPAYWRPLHAAEHLSSPETGHARCCRGPRSVDRVPGGVRGD